MAEVVKAKERKSIVKIDEDKHEEEVVQKRFIRERRQA